METLTVLYNTANKTPMLVSQDDATPEMLVLSHLRLVNATARKLNWGSIPLEDLIQAGNLGLVKASTKFDKSLGINFSVYATYYIKTEIHEYIMKNVSIVRSVTTKPRRKIFFGLNAYKRVLLQTIGQSGPLNNRQIKEYAESISVSEFDVREMEQALLSNVSIYSHNEDDEEIEPAYLKDERSTPYNQLQYALHEHMLNTELPAAINGLDSRTNDIIVSRYCSETPSTLWDLAAKYNVSAERIRQIEVAGMKKLKKHLELAQ